MRRTTLGTIGGFLAVLAAGAASAASTPEQKCQGDKNKAAGAYAKCRLDAEKALATNGDQARYDAAIAACETKFSAAWQKAIDGAAREGATCVDTPLVEADFKSAIDQCSTNVATALDGGGLLVFTPEGCGNGTVDAGEDCDIGTLGNATCADAGFTYGTLACGAGCVFDTSGCTDDRFVDTGLTIIDNQTGLEWEKKVLDPSCFEADQDDHDVHCVGDTYAWIDTGVGGEIGSMFGEEFLGRLNDCWSEVGQSLHLGFAGHCDWRIPQVDELRGILSAESPNCTVQPCIDPIFGPTSQFNYWSATTGPNDNVNGWQVSFGDGTVTLLGTNNIRRVRAVRSSSP